MILGLSFPLPPSAFRLIYMFQIKICGITGVEDAQAVVRAGADAVGLNFYAQSPRYVTLDQARAIVAVLPAEMVKVGVFVDTPRRGDMSDISMNLDWT